MRKSTRGQVAPFIVMDVMEAARAAEAAGRHIIHMEVGQPATAAPRAAREALARDMEKTRLATRCHWGCPSCGKASQAFIKIGIILNWTPPVW